MYAVQTDTGEPDNRVITEGLQPTLLPVFCSIPDGVYFPFITIQYAQMGFLFWTTDDPIFFFSSTEMHDNEGLYHLHRVGYWYGLRDVTLRGCTPKGLKYISRGSRLATWYFVLSTQRLGKNRRIMTNKT